MDLGLQDRLALVGGASDGLGYAVAESLAREGARVAIVSRSSEQLERAALRIRETVAGEVGTFVCDLSEVSTFPDLVKKVESSMGDIEILVYNTGGPASGSSLQFRPEDYRRALEQSFISAVALSNLTVPRMQKRRWGRVVAVASLTAKQPAPSMALSNSSRAALVAWAKSLSLEVARDGVLVNTVCPASVLTSRTRELAARRAASVGSTVETELAKAADAVPLGRFGRPQEFGDLVAFLCSERASFVTGSSISCDGGLAHGAF